MRTSMKKKLILAVTLCTALLGNPVMADVVSDPAPQSDIQAMLNANEYRQFFRAQVQKDLQQAEATEGKLDISLLMSPLTDEVLDRIATETIGKYWSAKYSKKYVEQLATPAGRLTAKFDQYAMKGTAQTEFLKLALKDRAAINEVQRSLPYKSLENAFRQGTPEFGKQVSAYLREKDNQRIRDGYKFFLQYLEAINAHADGKLAEAPEIQPPLSTGRQRIDTENQLLYQFILKRDQSDRVLSAKLNNGKLIDEILSQAALVDPVMLEKNLITIAEIEEMRAASATNYDKLLETYFAIDGGQTMTAAERRQRIKLTDTAASRMVTTSLEFAEAESAYYASVRRILLACQAAQGKLKLENGQLTFSQQKDLAEFDARRTEFLKALEVINALNDRERKRREQAIQNLRVKI